MDGRFKMGSAMSVVGPSQCGKTVFVTNLLKVHRYLFTTPITHIHWYCGILQPNILKQLKSEISGVEISMHQGLPDNFNIIESGNVIVLDDLMIESMSSQVVTNLFTKIVHHRNCFLINITQNLFVKGRDSKTRSLSTHYLILFNNPRDVTQVGFLSRQMNNKFLQAAFHDATEQGPYSYLLLDFHQSTPHEIRIRTRILPHEVPQYAYMTEERASLVINKRMELENNLYSQ